MIFNPNVMAAAGGGGAVVGTYVGNAPTDQEGMFEQRIECNFTVGAVILGGIKSTAVDTTFDHTELFTPEMSSLRYISFDGTGFIVKEENSYGNRKWYYTGLNFDGDRYYYIAIPKA